MRDWLIGKDTTSNFQAGVSVSAGNFGMLGGDAYVSGPISETLQFRLAGQYTKDDGWLPSLVPGAPRMEGGTSRSYGQTEILPTDRLTISVVGDYAKKRDTTGLGNFRCSLKRRPVSVRHLGLSSTRLATSTPVTSAASTTKSTNSARPCGVASYAPTLISEHSH